MPRNLIRALGALLAAWLAIGVAAAEPVDASGERASAAESTTVRVCVAADRGEDPATALLHPEQFRCGSGYAKAGAADFWVRPAFLPADAGTRLTRVRVASQWMRRLTLYARYADDRRVALSLGNVEITRNLRFGSILEQALPPSDVPLTNLVWHVEGSGNLRRVLGDATFATPEFSERDNLVNGVLYAGFVGLGLALIVFNLALWVALRHRFQLAYCAMVATLVLYIIASSGGIAWVYPWLPNTRRAALGYALLPLSAAASLWFAQTFLGGATLGRRTLIATRCLTGAMLALGGLLMMVSPDQIRFVDRLTGAAFVVMLIGTVPLLMAAWRRGGVFFGIFALAWAAPTMLAGMRVANTFRLLPVVFAVQRTVTIVMVVEALLSSLAIAYRIHLIGRERDEAREQEIAARLLADTDPLTGLLNRRSFLAQAIGRPGRQTLLLADLDHFKAVNETIGHDGGDEVLRSFARALRAAVPPGALVARIGGEEFACIAEEGANLSPNRILDSLRTARMPFDMTVTTSIGTCTGPLERETDWKLLYRNADRALFAAKAAGRDRARDAAQLSLAA